MGLLEVLAPPVPKPAPERLAACPEVFPRPAPGELKAKEAESEELGVGRLAAGLVPAEELELVLATLRKYGAPKRV